MKVLCILTKLICCLAICAGLAQADSMQLRNGRHLQGKYIGGTTTSIGFMTAGAVEIFRDFRRASADFRQQRFSAERIATQPDEGKISAAAATPTD